MNLINEASKLQHSVEDAKNAGKTINTIVVSPAFFNFCNTSNENWDKTLYGHPVKVDDSLPDAEYKLQ